MGKASSLSTKKQLRQSKKRQMANKSNKTRVKSQLKKVRGAAESGANAAARHKSRLTRLSNSKA